ncbi:glycosyltransferase family 2 protein [Pseudoponticoccus marisrubri]|uniref:Glucosyl transferase n=1 Tax=Pseudoponticoccus marisrubri TaxID=1685382 RepID=A0A0W7WPX9_9RHOB|nr:glycosyltransferase family 2 protein [Pseudoponticoccus marisrubri]KUF12604.1 glucosyl transferase [Pseudoponticoccus marisrubri]
MPLFSVILPAHNAAQTLPQTVASLQAQTCTDWEAIVVEDQSTDTTWQVACDLARPEPRLRVMRNTGKGPSAARNLGAAEARGEILAFCDADDLWTSTKLDGTAAALQGADAVFGRIGFFDGTPTHVRTHSTVPAAPVTIPVLMGENPVCTLSNLSLRKQDFDALEGFRTDMVHNEDLEFLIRLVGRGLILQGVDSLHVLYRLSPLGLSADLDAMQAGRATALETARRFGFRPDPRSEAVHLRYLARRALRLDLPGTALRLALRGLARAPRAFLSPLRRGALVSGGALVAPILPRALRRSLFCH